MVRYEKCQIKHIAIRIAIWVSRIAIRFLPYCFTPSQNVCLEEISYKFENVSCRVKNWVTRSNLIKPGHIFSPIIMKLDQHVCLDEIPQKFENRSCRVKTKSLGQMLEKPCVRSRRGHIFSQIIMKLDQHVCLDEI